MLLALVLAAMFLCACSSAPVNDVGDAIGPEAQGGDEAPAAGTEIALLTTDARLESPYGQGVWASIARFAGENGLSCGTYKTEPEDAGAALATLELAVRSGARLMACMDEVVSATVAGVLGQYDEVRFLLLDAPAGLGLQSNAAALRFSPLQAGFLAGYAATYEEPGLLGVALGGDDESTRYALGFLMGAETAATERQMAPESLWVIWLEADGGALEPKEEGQAAPPQAEEADWAEQVALLYTRGVKLVFAADPGDQETVLAAARQAEGRMLGIGLDMAGSGPELLGSLKFEASRLLYGQLAAWLEGEFPGGREILGGVAEGAVALSVEPSRFENARAWILEQGPLRFEGGFLAAQLERRAAPHSDGRLPSPGEMSLPHLLTVTPLRYDSLLAEQALEAESAADTATESELPGEADAASALQAE